MGTQSDDDIECALLWKLARSHGWSGSVRVPDLVGDANVSDEQRGRDIARNRLAGHSYIGYHNGKDEIWLDASDARSIKDMLVDSCGYGKPS